MASDVTPDELRRAYRRLVLEHHPDRARPDDRRLAEARTAAITTAYRVLRDPATRRRYDAEAAVPRRGTGGVRAAERPWAGDPRRPRPDHDPVLRRTRPDRPGRPGQAEADRTPAADTTPLADTVPRLALAAGTALLGFLTLVAGGATGAGALQLVGLALIGVGIVAVVLSELARKDGA